MSRLDEIVTSYIEEMGETEETAQTLSIADTEQERMTEVKYMAIANYVTQGMYDVLKSRLYELKESNVDLETIASFVIDTTDIDEDIRNWIKELW